LTVPADLTSQQKAEYQRLSKASAKNFDKPYMELMVKDHTNDLAAFQKAEAATENQELKKAIAAAIPVVEEHLNMAKSISAKLGGS
jgi:putative membrane protein